jgi:streptogramin lyase
MARCGMFDFVPYIGRMTVDGQYSDFVIADAGANGFFMSDITTGPDGNLWFVTGCTPKIFRMTPLGQVRAFPTSDGCPYRVTAGPDGNLWSTLHYGQKVAKISVTGAAKQPAISTPMEKWI